MLDGFIQQHDPSHTGEFGQKGHEESYQSVSNDKQHFDTLVSQIQKGQDSSYSQLQQSEEHLQGDVDHLCFCTGTFITTVEGEKAVESLQVGDEVLTASGDRKKVSWIGHQDVIFNKKEARPVKLKANAIADGVPYADLYTSPAHAFAFRATARGLLGSSTKDIFVRASALVNGSSVVQADMRRATYWHVELEGGHNILVANGAAAESFVDHGERHFFSNVTSAKATKVGKDCLPRKKSGKHVRAVQAQVNNRLPMFLGYAFEEGQHEINE